VTFRTLIRRSLRFHARAHFGVVLGAAVGSAALVGALLVGDSVRETLREKALSRIGPIHFALYTPDHLFKADLCKRLGAGPAPGYVPIDPRSPPYIYPASARPLASALVMQGVVARQDSSARANQVNVIAGLGPRQQTRSSNAEETAWVNETLAQQLSLRPGDVIVVRVRKPSALALDAVLSPRDQDSVALRLAVAAVATPEMLGDFSLSVGQLPPANLFVPVRLLEEKLGVQGQRNVACIGAVLERPPYNSWDKKRDGVAWWLRRRAPVIPLKTASGQNWNFYRLDTNSLLARMASGLEPEPEVPLDDEVAARWLSLQVEEAWHLEDIGLVVRGIEQPQTATGDEYIRPFVEVSSERIFLEAPIITAALTPRTLVLTNHPGFTWDNAKDVEFASFVTNGVPVLTYLANLIRIGDRTTPYSMVTAAGAQFLPADMRDDEIQINEWLAEDLQAKPGDSVELSYYVADSGSRLLQRTNSFRVRGVVPLKGRYADRTLMPEFPGLAKAESTHDWDAGFPLVYKIRDKDEAYWKKYRGTPKAFITLAAGQAIWASRFGSLTAIRYDVPPNSFTSVYREAAYRNLLANLDPAQLGLHFEPVRERALRAAEQSQDFGQLFLGFSFFLVLAALLLLALLFQFGLEQRAAEVGTLLALGFTSRQVRRLLLLEGAALALLGGILGTAGGLGYAQAMLWALTTIWRSAVGTSDLHFRASLASLLTGLLAGTIIAVLTIWLTLRRQARQPVHQLLAGELQSPKSKVQSRAAWVALGAGLAALATVAWALLQRDTANAEAFFSAGSLLLLAGVAAVSAWLARWGRKVSLRPLTLGGLGVRGCTRRRKRSLATIALLACGAFLIIAIGVFRQDANRDATSRSSGTGGFALLGESTLPVLQDLNTRSGLESLGLSERDLAGVNAVPFRVRQGDDASCLNLNRAQKPRLLGVNPALLAGRFTFDQILKGLPHDQPWNVLKNSALRTPHSALDEVPAVGDANSIQWALGKKIGDTLNYTDEHGRTFKLRLVGAVANSILQGSLIIDEAEFVKKFPSESGYRMFLIDAPSNSVLQVSATLSRALQDVGLELTPTVIRLNAFNAVQNTYLGTFQILGGLGLLLGSAGLGVVVLRNVLERRGELAVLLAVGFRRRALHGLVLCEHAALLGVGLSLGFVAAAIAVLPALLAPGHNLPLLSLTLTLGAVLLNGALWTWFATRYALRGNLLAALRNE
jgi:ABC-type antimicrobial peptide transport system permease subunit